MRAITSTVIRNITPASVIIIITQITSSASFPSAVASIRTVRVATVVTVAQSFQQFSVTPIRREVAGSRPLHSASVVVAVEAVKMPSSWPLVHRSSETATAETETGRIVDIAGSRTFPQLVAFQGQ